MAMFTQYAIAAARMAIKDANWETTTEEEKERTGVCLGSGIGSLDDMANTTLSFAESVSLQPHSASFYPSTYNR